MMWCSKVSFVPAVVAVCFTAKSTLSLAAGVNSSALCSTLSSRFHDKTFYPSDATYKASILSYFFQQDRLSPSCIFRPRTASDVSFIVMADAKLGDKENNSSALAVRSGGHAPVPYAANINKGVTIDLRNMNNTVISPDGSSVSVGAGSIWDDVYKTLLPRNLTVLGARVAGLGVGGYLTGGGISFFSPEKGFACDHIVNMEVVLANGSIINASHDQNADLFVALKGGSNNFGIVTRFDLQTFSHGNFWGGFVFYPSSTIPQQLAAFNGFMDPKNFDPYAEMICAIGYEAATSSFLVSNGIYYTKPVANPPVFHPFTSIQPQLGSTTRISNISDFVQEEEAQQAVNSRGLYANTVFSPGSQILEKVYSLFNSAVDSVKAVQGIQYFIIFQRVPAIEPGNSLGLSSSQGPLVLCLLSVTWDKAEDDELVYQVAEELIGAVERATKAAGLFNRYKYLNYAANFQDPIVSYGNESVGKLHQVSAKYDPRGFFQTRVPGGFKLMDSRSRVYDAGSSSASFSSA